MNQHETDRGPQAVEPDLTAGERFALRYTIGLNPAGAACSFIPKNACSLLRYSAAIHNGAIAAGSDPALIHALNRTFNLTLKEWDQSPYTFIFYRDPYRRLVSCFMDKIVGQASYCLNDLVSNMSRHPVRPGGQAQVVDIFEKITKHGTAALHFEDFVNLLYDGRRLYANAHWIPQHLFRVRSTYSDFFCVENMEHAKRELRAKCRFELHDPSLKLRHDLRHLKKVTHVDAHRSAASELRSLVECGEAYTYESFYQSAEVRQKVDEMYQKDLAIFHEHFQDYALTL